MASQTSGATSAASSSHPISLPQPATSSLFFADTLFTQLGLDSRLWKALASQQLTRLTLVQKECIPHILRGANVLVQAKTGSGKTLAYAIPILQQILLQQTSDSESTESTRLSRVILLPSLELCDQVRATVKSLLKYCDDTVKVIALKADTVDPGQIRENPDILIATPAQLLKYCQHSAGIGGTGATTSSKKKDSTFGYLSSLPTQLRHLVLDEADLILGQGYSEDLSELLNNSSYLGKNFQISLFSATLDEEIEELKNLYMPPPCVTIKIKDPTGSALGKAKLTQLYHQVNTHQDKFFMTLCLLQTHLISASAKILIFINTIPDAYKLKLFLEQFSIASAVLNHELPRNSRQSILDHFNRGVIDILIATDEATGETPDDEDDEEEEADGSDEEMDADESKTSTSAVKPSKKRSANGALKAEVEEPFTNSFQPSVEVTIEETRTVKKKAKKEEVAAATASKTNSKKKKATKADAEEAMEIDDDDVEEKDGDEVDEDDVAVKTEVSEETAHLDRALAELEHMKKIEKRNARKEKRKQAKAAAAAGFGSSNVSRGVDFKDVGTVLNFDFPHSIKNYTHRCGRTARANRSGVALSFVEPNERELLEVMLLYQHEQRRGMGLEVAPGDLQPLPFDAQLLDGLRYRCTDKIRAVTSIAIREARLKEIKSELLNSERLKSHFEDNPRELALLRHDQVLRSKGIQKHLSTLPSYLLPEYMQNGGDGSQPISVASGGDSSDANRNKARRNKHKAKIASGNILANSGIDKLKGFALKKAKGRHTMAQKNATDPLRSFRSKPLNAAAAQTTKTATKTNVDF